MRTSMMQRKTTTGQVVLATALLVGILLIAYGYLRQTKSALYVGLALTAGGVLVGVVETVSRRSN